MGRHRCKAAWRCSAVVLAVAVVVPVGSGTAATMEASAVPAKLAGSWGRTVTSSDLRRVKVPPTSLKTGAWSIAIVKSQEGIDFMDIYAPGDPVGVGLPSFAGYISVAGKGMRITASSGYEIPICDTKAIYRWKVVGKLLTMSKVSDTCRERVAVFTGVWKRK